MPRQRKELWAIVRGGHYRSCVAAAAIICFPAEAVVGDGRSQYITPPKQYHTHTNTNAHARVCVCVCSGGGRVMHLPIMCMYCKRGE